MAFNTGDRIIVIKDGTHAPVGAVGTILDSGWVRWDNKDYCSGSSGCSSSQDYDDSYFKKYGSRDPELNNNNQEKAMASLGVLSNAKLSADDRFALAEYLENADGSLTNDGRAIFLEYLYQEEGVRAKFIKAVRTAKKKVANDEKEYSNSVHADKDE